MSLVPPSAPPSCPSGHGRSRKQGGRGQPSNWFFVHLLLCFIVILGCKAALRSYSSFKTPPVHPSDETDGKIGSTAQGGSVLKSPLQEISSMEANNLVSLSDDDVSILSDIHSRAALDIKFFAIPETLYPQNEGNLLYQYIEKQLESAKDVLTPGQSEFVLKLIESGVAQGSMVKKETGDKGSLKNSMVIALLKEDVGKLHFAMAAVSVEPRLGWRMITRKQRNAWNDVLSRAAESRLKEEIANLFVSSHVSTNKEAE